MCTDLVLAALGGIKDSAYEVDAELTRMSMDTNQFTKIDHIRIQPRFLLKFIKFLGDIYLQPHFWKLMDLRSFVLNPTTG